MGMPASVRHHWTAREVRALMDPSRHWPRYELLHGELIMTSAPTAHHQLAVKALLLDLEAYTEQQNIGIALMSPSDLELADEQILQPDVFVVPADVWREDAQVNWSTVKRLLLAVEVLSPSSVRYDRVEKREFYLENGVDEYWVVDLDARMIERWTPSRPTPEVCRKSLAWLPAGASAPFMLDLRTFFVDRVRLPRMI